MHGSPPPTCWTSATRRCTTSRDRRDGSTPKPERQDGERNCARANVAFRDRSEGIGVPLSGYRAGQTLAADPSVSAIFVANDQMALGVILALLAARRVIGSDVALVGFDDTPESEYYAAPLTTIRQDLDEVGRRAVELLLDIMAGGESRQIRIEPSLVERFSSTGRRD